jgi:hypothetical protein
VIAFTRQISCAKNSSNPSVLGVVLFLGAHFSNRGILIEVGLIIMK